jgi:hypothetical protein
MGYLSQLSHLSLRMGCYAIACFRMQAVAEGVVTQHVVVGYTVVLPVILQQAAVGAVIVLQPLLRGILLLPVILH